MPSHHSLWTGRNLIPQYESIAFLSYPDKSEVLHIMWKLFQITYKYNMLADQGFLPLIPGATILMYCAFEPRNLLLGERARDDNDRNEIGTLRVYCIVFLSIYVAFKFYDMLHQEEAHHEMQETSAETQRPSEVQK